jgi:hypothetical protein
VIQDKGRIALSHRLVSTSDALKMRIFYSSVGFQQQKTIRAGDCVWGTLEKIVQFVRFGKWIGIFYIHIAINRSGKAVISAIRAYMSIGAAPRKPRNSLPAPRPLAMHATSSGLIGAMRSAMTL